MIENYFLGCNSSTGFYSLYNELYRQDYKQKLYILKGGPGTGKSSIMKNIAKQSSELDYNIEKIYCSSDPDSLDAVIIKDLNITVADGTAPHILEPKYPRIIEKIINLGEYWNEEKLNNNKTDIINLINENKEYHNKCVIELNKAYNIQNENNLLLRKYININKTDEYKKKIIKDDYKVGIIKKRILTAVTPKGIYTLKNNFEKDTIFIEDKFNCISKILLNKLSKEDIGDKILGLDFINCKYVNSVITNKNIYTDNKNSNYNNVINIDDAYYTIPKSKENLIIENINLIAEKLNNAVQYSQMAKLIHNKMEDYYINAMDFDKINKLSDNLIKNIFN